MVHNFIIFILNLKIIYNSQQIFKMQFYLSNLNKVHIILLF